MNVQRKKEMGLEIGRAIHLAKNQDELYEKIMIVAEEFCDKTSIACGMAVVQVDTDDSDMTTDRLDLLVDRLDALAEDDETKEIIPE